MRGKYDYRGLRLKNTHPESCCRYRMSKSVGEDVGASKPQQVGKKEWQAYLPPAHIIWTWHPVSQHSQRHSDTERHKLNQGDSRTGRQLHVYCGRTLHVSRTEVRRVIWEQGDTIWQDTWGSRYVDGIPNLHIQIQELGQWLSILISQWRAGAGHGNILLYWRKK